MFGRSRGVEFSLSYQLQLTPEEQELVDRYGLADYVIAERDDDRGKLVRVTVADAQRGDRYVASSIAKAVNGESVVRSSCQDLAGLLRAARGYGGDETIDF